jgi:hypothetical protein
VGHYSSFILRLWVEPDNHWRWGVIEHVATREKVRFLSPEEILSFIAAHTTVDELSIPFVLDSSEADQKQQGQDEGRMTKDEGDVKRET